MKKVLFAVFAASAVFALAGCKEKKNVVPNLARLAASANAETGVINSEMADLLKQYELLGDSAND